MDVKTRVAVASMLIDALLEHDTGFGVMKPVTVALPQGDALKNRIARNKYWDSSFDSTD